MYAFCTTTRALLYIIYIGYTLGFWVKFDGTNHKDKEGVYMSNGGQSPSSHGIAMYYKDGKLTFKFRRKNGDEWTASSDNVLVGRWYHVAVTWSLNNGLFLYINGRQSARDLSPTSTAHNRLDNRMNAFYIGRPNNDGFRHDYGSMAIDEFHFWSMFSTPEDIREMGQFSSIIFDTIS